MYTVLRTLQASFNKLQTVYYIRKLSALSSDGSSEDEMCDGSVVCLAEKYPINPAPSNMAYCNATILYACIVQKRHADINNKISASDDSFHGSMKIMPMIKNVVSYSTIQYMLSCCHKVAAGLQLSTTKGS